MAIPPTFKASNLDLLPHPDLHLQSSIAPLHADPHSSLLPPACQSHGDGHCHLDFIVPAEINCGEQKVYYLLTRVDTEDPRELAKLSLGCMGMLTEFTEIVMAASSSRMFTA